MTLSQLKSKLHKNANNYLIMKTDDFTTYINYKVDNGLYLDLMIGALESVLKLLNERKDKRDHETTETITK